MIASPVFIVSNHLVMQAYRHLFCHAASSQRCVSKHSFLFDYSLLSIELTYRSLVLGDWGHLTPKQASHRKRLIQKGVQNNLSF